MRGTQISALIPSTTKFSKIFAMASASSKVLLFCFAVTILSHNSGAQLTCDAEPDIFLTCSSNQYFSADQVTYTATSRSTTSMCCQAAGAENGREIFESLGCGTSVSGTVEWEGYQGGTVMVNPKIRCQTSGTTSMVYDWSHSSKLAGDSNVKPKLA